MSENYSKEYSEEGLFKKIASFAKKAGLKVIYVVLVLYYTLQKPDLPAWAYAIIIGALGYFIMPLDAVPDVTPAVGYIDDFGALMGAAGSVAVHIDKNTRRQAVAKLDDIFGNIDERELPELGE